MAKIVDITDKLNFEEKPQITVKGEIFTVNNEAETILKIIPLADEGSAKSLAKIAPMLLNDVSIGGTSAAEQYDFYIDAGAEDYAVTGFDSVDTHSIGMYDMFADSPQDKPYDLDNPLVLAGYVSPAAVGDQFRDAFYAVRDAVRPNYTIAYTPFDLKAQARLWVQPGDRVRFNIRWYSLEVDPETGAETATAHTMTVNSVVLSRRITGIQAMTDELEAR